MRIDCLVVGSSSTMRTVGRLPACADWTTGSLATVTFPALPRGVFSDDERPVPYQPMPHRSCQLVACRDVTGEPDRPSANSARVPCWSAGLTVLVFSGKLRGGTSAGA